MRIKSVATGIAMVATQTFGVAFPAFAQGEDTARRQGIDEIVVTAQRREASLQDTDIAISAFTEGTLQELGIASYGDIGDFVPNMLTHETVGTAGAAVNIRGMKNAETLITFEPKVAVYLDGVLLGKNTGSAFDIVDLERVEVLRGPQGTLYGRNTVGGAINLVTKKPSDEFGGSLATTLGSYDQRDLKGTLNVPLIGPHGVLADGTASTLNLRATLATLNRDGYWKNDGPSGDRRLGDKDREAAYIQLQWQPNDRVSLLYAYDMTDADETGTPRPATFVRESFIPGSPSLADIARHVVRDNDFRVSFDFPQIQTLDAEGHSLTADFDLGDNLSLVSISAWREMENIGWGDSDGTPLAIRGSTQGSEHKMYTQELRLVGNAMADQLKYVIGAFYMSERGDIYNGNILAAANDINIATFDNDIWALFAEGTYSLTERLDLTLGARYTEERREMAKQTYRFPAGDQYFPSPDDMPIIDASSDPKTWSDVSGTVSLSYRWTDDLMTYAKVAKGFASGGFNARAANETAFHRPFDEETLISYEIGMKSTWFDNRLLVNGAVFYNDYQDLQVNQFDPVSAVNNFSNAGDAVINGFELEVQAQVSDNLQVGGSYGYLDPEYKTFIAADGADLSSSYWAHSPKHNGHIFVRYVVPAAIAGGDLSTRVDWMYQDDIRMLTLNPLPYGEPNSQKAYDHINARVSLEELHGFGKGSLSIALWGKNLTNESWRTTGVNFVTYAINSWGPPRTWGIDINYSF
ncbi:MAG TPA: TonB-dependent receptor [Porticoccaceae bacterium]